MTMDDDFIEEQEPKEPAAHICRCGHPDWPGSCPGWRSCPIWDDDGKEENPMGPKIAQWIAKADPAGIRALAEFIAFELAPEDMDIFVNWVRVHEE